MDTSHPTPPHSASAFDEALKSGDEPELRRLAEESTWLLAAIVDSSDDAIVSKSLEGIVTSWNTSAERIFGFMAAEAIGRPVTLIIPPDRLEEEPHILSRIRRGERVDHFETVRRCKDGRLIDVSLTISPVRNRHGQIVGASKVARDITDRKRADRALKLAQDALSHSHLELEKKVEERTASLREAISQMEEFSYTVSHDLRSPLRAMRGYSRILLEEFSGNLGSEGTHYARRIAENAERLDRMVTDILTYSRVGRGQLQLETIALDPLLRELVTQQTLPGGREPRITVEPLVRVIGHEPSLVQAVSNLLTNALKFVAVGVQPQIRIWTETNGAAVRLWIQDNGIGIRPELQGRLFNMFERLHPDLPFEGMGVGLAIVRKAAARMGGTVGVESDGVNGSRFWIELPRPPEDSTGAPN